MAPSDIAGEIVGSATTIPWRRFPDVSGEFTIHRIQERRAPKDVRKGRAPFDIADEMVGSTLTAMRSLCGGFLVVSGDFTASKNGEVLRKSNEKRGSAG
ncbi:hypothetical protein BHE74_00007693 [Ensete ventricosum]|nr:hypothetical protein BHE74_00007693 [Ensete ventricosum]